MKRNAMYIKMKVLAVCGGLTTPNLSRFVLGFHGEGRKTLCAVANTKGRVLSKGLSGSSDYTESREIIKKNIKEARLNAVKRLSETEQEAIEIAVLGLDGANLNADREKLKFLLAPLRLAKHIKIMQNGDIALQSLFQMTHVSSGIVVLAGTGSVAFGRTNTDQEKAGGWGPLIGDEGSKYYIGKNALKRMMYVYEGRLRKETKLVRMLIEHFGIRNPPDIIQHLRSVNDKNRIKEIANLSNLVIQCVRNYDDAMALEILNEAGIELGLHVVALARKLKMRRGVTLGLTGTAFKEARELIINPMTDTIEKASVGIKAIYQVEPVFGSLLVALESRGININQAIVNNLAESGREFDLSTEVL